MSEEIKKTAEEENESALSPEDAEKVAGGFQFGAATGAATGVATGVASGNVEGPMAKLGINVPHGRL